MDVATIWEEPDLQLITRAAEYFFSKYLGASELNYILKNRKKRIHCSL